MQVTCSKKIVPDANFLFFSYPIAIQTPFIEILFFFQQVLHSKSYFFFLKLLDDFCYLSELNVKGRQSFTWLYNKCY